MGAGKTLATGFSVLAINGIVGVRAERPLTELAGDEARRLAICLLEAAQEAERPEPPEWP
ncbi:hypothetical protein [Curtobacterium sp. PhB136]|uniref:hypothetical protein n=1 Tax=Curtobacterium sp. PhB136 TaxID=2485181 RepID=UPI00104DE74A|nr:hypothetical protein [Curtobacterium sp. PhB136]TCK63616.1 hypothetical protein EDF27_2161 [Curtobacterium sp. PhB136]